MFLILIKNIKNIQYYIYWIIIQIIIFGRSKLQHDHFFNDQSQIQSMPSKPLIEILFTFYIYIYMYIYIYYITKDRHSRSQNLPLALKTKFVFSKLICFSYCAIKISANGVFLKIRLEPWLSEHWALVLMWEIWLCIWTTFWSLLFDLVSLHFEYQSKQQKRLENI